jgi:hypothetical protein
VNSMFEKLRVSRTLAALNLLAFARHLLTVLSDIWAIGHTGMSGRTVSGPHALVFLEANQPRHGQGRGKYQRMIRAMVNEAITD